MYRRNDSQLEEACGEGGGGEMDEASPYCASFFADEIMAARSAIYFRYDASRSVTSVHRCRLAIRRSDSSTSLASRFFLIRLSSRECSVSRSLTFFFFLCFFFFTFLPTSIRFSSDEVEGGLSTRGKGGCDLLVPFVRSTAYDFRGDKIRARCSRNRSDWKPKWIFPGISGVHLVSEII